MDEIVDTSYHFEILDGHWQLYTTLIWSSGWRTKSFSLKYFFCVCSFVDVWYVLKMYHIRYNLMIIVNPRFMASQVPDCIYGYEVLRVETRVINVVRWKIMF